MGQDIARGSQEPVVGTQISGYFDLKNVQINVSEDTILRKSDESIDNRGGEDVTVYLGVPSDVRNKLVIGHVSVTVTAPTCPNPTTKVGSGAGCMLFVLEALPRLWIRPSPGIPTYTTKGSMMSGRG
jgi:hypothetical protein